MDYRLIGNEKFTLNDEELDLSILDFWRWHFCDRFDLQDKMAEYIVAKALGLEKAYNIRNWTLFDILYREKRIEVKETSYYHSWQTDEEPKSKQRNFGITKAHTEYQNSYSPLARQNDIYVFCLKTGNTKSESDPLKLENWEFYIIPTSTINAECGDAKSVSLSRIRNMTDKVGYVDIRKTVDSIINQSIR